MSETVAGQAVQSDALLDVSGPFCKACHSELDWVECEQCSGEGVDGHECGEDCCCCADPEDNVPCDACGGKAGWWQCYACTANVTPDRTATR